MNETKKIITENENGVSTVVKKELTEDESISSKVVQTPKDIRISL